MKKFYVPCPKPFASYEVPNEVPNEFQIGDEVYIDYGLSGKLGPGTITGRIEFDDFIGFVVKLPLTPYEETEMGWIESSRLIPA